MTEDLFSEFADLKSLEDQKKKVLAIFSDISKGVKGLSQLGIKIEGAKGVKELSGAQDEYNKYIKDAERLQKQLLESQKKLYESESQYAKLIAANRVEQKKRNDELKAEAQLEGAAAGSKERAKAQLKLLRLESEKLNLTTAEGRKKNEELIKSIDKLDSFIKKNSDTLTQQKINIGNYAGSLAKPFELLQKKLNEIKKNLSQGVGIGGTDEASLKKGEAAAQIIEKTLKKSSAAGTTSIKQVKDLSNAYNDLSITIGKSGGTTETSFLTILGDSVGEAKDNVEDLKEELKLKASDTKGIDNIVGSLNALAGVAQGAAGAYALFGGSQEDAAVITSKLIAIQGIANSVQQVGQEITRRGSILYKAAAYIQGLYAVATDGAAASTARLNAILKLSTIGLVIGLIGGLVYAISALVTSTSEYAKKQALLNDLKREGNKNAAEELTKLKLVYSGSQNLTLSIAERTKAAKYLQTTYPETFKNFTTEQILAGKAKAAYDLLTASILKTALAQAARGKLTELGAQELDAYSEYASKRKELESLIPRITKSDADIAKENGLANESQIATFKRNAKIVAEARRKDINELVKDYAEKLKVIKENEKTIVDFVGAENLIDEVIGAPAKAEKAEKVETKKITDNTFAEILKEQFEQKKILLQQGLDADRKVFEDETQIYKDRLDALKTFTAGQINLINLEKEFEIENEKLRLAAVIAGLEEQKKEKGANRKAIDEQEVKERDLSNEKLITIQLRANDSILKAGEQFNISLKSLKDGRAALLKEEEQDLLDYEEFTMGWLKSFRQKQREMNKEWDDGDKAQKQKTYDDFKNLAINFSKELQDTLLSFLTASIDNELATIDTRKRLQEEDVQRRINQINLLGLTEQERVKRTAEIEKQAAFDSEQLERRRRKLLVERAKFEKIANIASIISSTAQAVVSALGQKPWTPLNIALAAVVGGIGVLQLARAVAAPLPQYFKGTDSAAKGMAMVGEQGEELMQKDGKYYLTPGKPTLMEMAGGEKIFTANTTKDIMNSISFSKSMRDGMMSLQANGMSSQQADTMIDEIKDLKKETSKSRTSLTLVSDNGWNVYVKKNIK